MSELEQKAVEPLLSDDSLLSDDPLLEAAAVDEAQPASLEPQKSAQPRTQKPGSNVYTMMLILSLAAIITACVVLYLHLDPYGDYPWWEIPQDISADV